MRHPGDFRGNLIGPEDMKKATEREKDIIGVETCIKSSTFPGTRHHLKQSASSHFRKPPPQSA